MAVSIKHLKSLEIGNGRRPPDATRNRLSLGTTQFLSTCRCMIAVIEATAETMLGGVEWDCRPGRAATTEVQSIVAA